MNDVSNNLYDCVPKRISWIRWNAHKRRNQMPVWRIGWLIFLWGMAGCQRGENVLTVVLNPVNPAVVYVGTTGGGFYKSVDAGATFTRRTAGLSRYNISAIVVNPVLPTLLFAGTYGDRIYRSIDGGAHWMPLPVGLDDNVGTQAVNALVIPPHQPEALYAATNHGVYKSTDNGGEWKGMNLGVGNRFGIALVLHPGDHRILAVGTNRGIYVSWDAAVTWRPAVPETKAWAVNSLIFDPRGEVVAGTDQGVLRLNLTENPIRWQTQNTGLTSSFIVALSADAQSPDTLYAGHRDGIDMTVDGARSWRRLPQSPRAVTAIAIDPRNGAVLYAGTAAGLYQSRDHGEHWTPLALNP